MKTKVFQIFFIFFLFSIIEILSGSYFFGNKINCIYLNCNQKYTIEVNYLEKEKYSIINYSRDKYGLRGVKKKYDEIDFLVVGGSTTDEKFMDLKNTWTEKIEQKFINDDLNIDVVNAGVDGQSTLGHIYNFENWFFEIKNLSPKFIIFYIGINENRNENFNRFDNQARSGFLQKVKFIIKRNNGVLINFYRKIRTKYFIPKIGSSNFANVHQPNKVKKYILKKDLDFETSRELMNQWISTEFIKRLEILSSYSRKIGAKPIFISQRSYRWFLKNGNLYEIDDAKIQSNELTDSYYFKEKIISEAIKKFSINNKIYFIDGFNLLKLEKDLLYDYVHTNIEGSEYISKTLYPSLKKIYLN